MSAQIQISLPDGSVRHYPQGTTPLQVAESISQGLARNALVATVNGKRTELQTPLTTDAQLRLHTWKDAEGKEAFWHSSAHILAEALESLYPGIQLGFGPPIEEGFYYDIDFGDHKFSEEDFPQIEARFMELARSGETFRMRAVSKADALAYYQARGATYKVELINELQDGTITFCDSGNFTDLCKGGHIDNSKVIKAVKLLHTAGAYWRGNSANKQLTRIYAISFPSQKELEDHLHLLEEAKKRDHRRLGKELDMFSFHEEGPGFPFWHHNGMVVLNELQTYLRHRLFDSGYEEIKTPLILNEELWHRSGHWHNYGENMYFTHIDEENYAVKPMNCPGATIVYKNSPRSYKDLPLRLFEFGLVHRHELSGVLTGLFRVRAFTQDDAHIFCTFEQIEAEVTKLIDFILEIYALFGFHDVDIFLSTRPEDKYVGTLEQWDKAESYLKATLERRQVPFTINEGDGAFYGPKIDFVVRDSLRRRWQLGTIQLDFNMPKRFGLEYVGADNDTIQPVMIHRALLGSFERFFGILLEHTAGNLPLWLAPRQVVILPISDKFNAYGDEIYATLKKAGIRADKDYRNEKISRKIRDAEVHKVPWMLIIGEKEAQNQSVSLRVHTEGDKGNVSLSETVEMLKNAITQSQKPTPEPQFTA
ncbi:MAG: threonine--tRNA ligase [Bacteroidetes bacterium]|nr:threonine--tRNA ligase [Bacteroidota bacterium]